jgi:predicted HTH domain antitoxin
MQTVGIKELKNNPSILSKTFDRHDYLLITRRGQPIGIASAFDDQVLDLGYRKWVAIRSFQAGDLSLGQVARVFDKNKLEMMRLLSELGVPLADYDLQEDLDTLNALGT